MLSPYAVGLRALWLSAAFLVASAALHIAAPATAEQLLSRAGVVRAVGALLAVLGAASFLAGGILARLVAVVLLLSGVRRALDPDGMIETMHWASRPLHGLLILVGATGTAFVAYRTARAARDGRDGGDGR